MVLSKMKKAIALIVTILLSVSLVNLVVAETAYQRWLRMATSARNQGHYDAALSYYGRAAEVSPDGPNDGEINTAIEQVLAERLQSFQRTAPNYVRYIRVADEAFFDGNYDTAILNYRRALREQPKDYYATVRIQQAECIKEKKPATGAQFRAFGCPNF